jgi:hypothetical protein
LLPYFSLKLAHYSLGSGVIYGLFNLAYSIGMFFGPLAVSVLRPFNTFESMIQIFVIVILISSALLISTLYFNIGYEFKRIRKTSDLG